MPALLCPTPATVIRRRRKGRETGGFFGTNPIKRQFPGQAVYELASCGMPET